MESAFLTAATSLHGSNGCHLQQPDQAADLCLAIRRTYFDTLMLVFNVTCTTCHMYNLASAELYGPLRVCPCLLLRCLCAERLPIICRRAYTHCNVLLLLTCSTHIHSTFSAATLPLSLSPFCCLGRILSHRAKHMQATLLYCRH